MYYMLFFFIPFGFLYLFYLIKKNTNQVVPAPAASTSSLMSKDLQFPVSTSLLISFAISIPSMTLLVIKTLY